MARMNEDDLLKRLQDEESKAVQFTATLSTERSALARGYYRQPYGDEEAGWSSIVTGEMQETVEWILPDLLDMFVSSDNAVEYEPTRAGEQKDAEDATHAANHVFYRQNSGFLVLHEAFKDALMVRLGVLHWRKETERFVEKHAFQGATATDVAVMLTSASRDAEIDEDSIEQVGVSPMGEPLLSGTIRVPGERKKIIVEALDPNHVHVPETWTSPLLDRCPYVMRDVLVTLSDCKQMGLKIDAEELASSAQPVSNEGGIDQRYRDRMGRRDTIERDQAGVNAEDESQTQGWLRFEWVLADFDGDGIAERRCIIRTEREILANDECNGVPIAIGAPILAPHHWDGLAVTDAVADLQEIKTQLARGIINNAYGSQNPRKVVLEDNMGAPVVNIDDLLDGRHGGIIRTRNMQGLQLEQTPFVGNQMLPLMDHVDQWVEKRTGVSRLAQGIDPNVLRSDRTAFETAQLTNAAAKRIKLIARVLAEVLVKPMFKGVLQLLTEGDMQPLFFKLNGRFVELDPNDWSDQYEIVSHVGTGTGDVDKQLAGLREIEAKQLGLAKSPLAFMVKPHQIYANLKQQARLLGHKNVQDYFVEPAPDAPMPTPPPPPPDPAIVTAQIRAQADKENRIIEAHVEAQREQWKARTEAQRQQNEFQLQATNDLRDAAREDAIAQRAHDLALARLAVERESDIRRNATSVVVARITHPGELPEGVGIDPATGEVFEKPDLAALVSDELQAIKQRATAPKTMLRDDNGEPYGYEQAGERWIYTRDEAGRITGAEPETA